MPKQDRLKVGVYVNDTHATVLRLVRCLREWDMSFVSIWRDELPRLKTFGVDVLLLHGGWYGIGCVPPQNQHEKAQQPHHKRAQKAVRDYVRAGGGVVGVCCGAFNLVWMDLIEADISRAPGAGLHAMEVVDDRHPITKGVIERAKGRQDRKWKAVPVVRINGPILFPRDPGTMVFSYDWERRLGAVLAAGYGAGRAVAVSPHPERTERDVSFAPGGDIPTGPLMPAAGLLKNALLWTAGRDV